MHKIVFTKHFWRKFKRQSKRNQQLEEKMVKVIAQLSRDPFDRALKTHKVSSRVKKEAFSSRVTSDLRIIWMFQGEHVTILLLDFGGHSGANKVYR